MKKKLLAITLVFCLSLSLLGSMPLATMAATLESWEDVSGLDGQNGLPGNTLEVNALLEAADGTLYNGTNGAGVWAFDGGSTWTNVSGQGLSGKSASALLETADRTLYAGTLGEGVWAVDGTDWTNVSGIAGAGGLATGGARSVHALLEAADGTLYAATDGAGVWAFGGGTTWTDVSGQGLSGKYVIALAECGGTLYAGTFNEGVWAFGGGTTWTDVSAQGLSGKSVITLVEYGGTLYAGANNAGVWAFVGGTTWTDVSGIVGAGGLAAGAARNVVVLVECGNRLYAGTGGGVWRTENLYHITYNANGAPSGDVPVDPNSPYAAGSSVTVLGPGTLEMLGYTFGGWYNDIDDEIYQAGETFVMPAEDVELIAVWGRIALNNRTGGGGSGIVNSTIKPTVINPSMGIDGSYPDALITLTENGNSFLNLKNGSAILEQGKDYTKELSKVTVSGAYLATLAPGQSFITFDMNWGVDPVLTVNIDDGAIVLTMGSTVVVQGGSVIASPPVAPQIINDRAMLPFRYLMQTLLGGEVRWDEETRTINATVKGGNFRLEIGSNVVYINGEAVTIDSPPVIVGDYTLVPLRVFEAVMESLTWDAATRTVTIVL